MVKELYVVSLELGEHQFVRLYHQITPTKMDLDEQWKTLPQSMRSKRSACVSAVANGRLFVFGGVSHRDSTYDVLSSAEVYNPRTGMWEDIPPMSKKRHGCAAAVVNEHIYIIGGCGAVRDGREDALPLTVVYDVRNSKWSTVPASMSTPRSHMSATAIEEKIYVVGGLDDDCVVLSSVECYDTRTKGWTSILSMTTKRCSCATAAVGRHLYVFGGFSGISQLSSVEQYDVDSKVWKSLPPMRVIYGFCVAAVVEDKIYVCGGKAATLSIPTTGEVFDTRSETWAPLPDMKLQLRYCTAAALDRKVFVIGGRSRSCDFSSVRTYDTLAAEIRNTGRVPDFFLDSKFPKKLCPDALAAVNKLAMDKLGEKSLSLLFSFVRKNSCEVVAYSLSPVKT